MAFPYPYVGPIALYNNLPIEPQFYQPNRFVISSIALGQTTIVTTRENLNFAISQLVRLLIPPSFGSYQLNEMEGYVLSLPTSNSVEISIDSLRNVDPFVIPPTTTDSAQIIPVGDISSGPINTNGRTGNITFISGSFINISPL
jgi:hypothetical protein